MKLHRIDDPQRLTQLIRRFFSQRPCVISVYHFGSTAEKGEGRDLDIAVFCSEELDEFRLGSELERFLFENGIRLPVDLKVMNRTPIWAKYEVIKGGRRVFAREPDEAAELEARVIDEYLDFKPLMDTYTRFFFRRLRDEAKRNRPTPSGGDG